nr:16S rRNA (guanine(527)-N(7))-methyltransferase RsmG [Paracoccus sp. S-4012]
MEHYTALIRHWNRAINLVSRADLEHFQQRHIEDSLQLVELNADPGSDWADLGSGGGLPGVVAACALKGKATKVTLVESDRRKATFLQRTVADLGLAARVICARAEAVEPLAASTVSARALAPLPLLLSYASRHLATDGVAFFPKGASWNDELADARAAWVFDLAVHPSRTGNGVILEVRDLHAR